MKKFIITGGPNSGKSTIIDLLSKKGHSVLTESARLIIEQRKMYPWDDQKAFCDAVRHEQMRREGQIRAHIVFLDRSLVDPVAYAEIAYVDVDQSAYKNIHDALYEREVFFLEMLPRYTLDEQRKETPEQAAAVHNRLRLVYRRLGFTLIDVPLFSSDEDASKRLRLEFILKRTAEAATSRERNQIDEF